MLNAKTFHTVAAMVVLSTVIAVSGCGTKKEIQVKEENNFVEETAVLDRTLKNKNSVSGNNLVSDPEHEFDDLTEEQINAAPDVDSITESQLANMTTDEFRAFIAKNSPNYRENFVIAEDKIMEDSDWLSLRYLVNYQLFGHLWFQIEEESEDSSQMSEEEQAELVLKEQTDVSDISKEEFEEIATLVNSLTDEEFISFLNEIYEESGYESLGLEYLTKEELKQFRSDIMSGIEELKKDAKSIEKL